MAETTLPDTGTEMKTIVGGDDPKFCYWTDSGRPPLVVVHGGFGDRMPWGPLCSIPPVTDEDKSYTDYIVSVSPGAFVSRRPYPRDQWALLPSSAAWHQWPCGSSDEMRNRGF